MRRIERDKDYWRGVKACALWLGGTALGSAAFIYYVLEIVKSFSAS